MITDTHDILSKNNPVFSKDELIIESDTGSFKIGDGVTHYNDLPVSGTDIAGTYVRLVAVEAAASAIMKTPTVDVADNKTLALTDAKTMQLISAAAVITVPLNADVEIPVGTEIELFTTTASAVSVAGDVDGEDTVTVNSLSGNMVLAGQYAWAKLKKIDDDEWIFFGDLISGS